MKRVQKAERRQKRRAEAREARKADSANDTALLRGIVVSNPEKAREFLRPRFWPQTQEAARRRRQAERRSET